MERESKPEGVGLFFLFSTEEQTGAWMSRLNYLRKERRVTNNLELGRLAGALT